MIRAAGAAVVAATLACHPAHAATVQVEVASDDPQLRAVEARMRWLGEDRSLPLERDASGVWTATLEGEAVRLLPVELWVEGRSGRSERAYSGLERIEDEPARLSYAIERASPAQGRRLSRAAPVAQVTAGEAQRVGLGLAWVLACVLAVGAMARRPGVAPAEQSSAPWRWPTLSVPLIWVLLAVAWTWPAVRAGDGVAVGRHFDLPGTLWAIDAAARLVPDLRDGLTAWPLGGDYRRFDSFTLLPIAWLYKAADPARLHGLMAAAGLALTGIATQGFARAVGARAAHAVSRENRAHPGPGRGRHRQQG